MLGAMFWVVNPFISFDRALNITPLLLQLSNWNASIPRLCVAFQCGDIVDALESNWAENAIILLSPIYLTKFAHLRLCNYPMLLTPPMKIGSAIWHRTRQTVRWQVVVMWSPNANYHDDPAFINYYACPDKFVTYLAEPLESLFVSNLDDLTNHLTICRRFACSHAYHVHDGFRNFAH